MTRAHVLIVDDEPNVRRVLATLLEQAGYETTRTASAEQALELVRAQDPDLVLTDLKMPGMDGLELLRRLHVAFPEIPVLLLTAHGTIADAVEAMKRGAYDFLTKPFDREQVVELVGRAVGQASSARRETSGPLADGAPCGIVGRSPAIEALRARILRVAGSPATVLIRGETGTGKELVAEAIHRHSTRAAGPMIRVNCGALPESLIESELFGHTRGAFTGAERDKPGRFELADGGSLFLDEIGDMPAAAQVKLLRVLEDGRVDRVGGKEPVTVDVRLIAATHRDLRREVGDGRFREDLYYRLAVIELTVPPLRDRPEDVPPLVEYFLDRHAGRLERPRPAVEDGVIESLAARPWPGNVRELENAVERALVLAASDTLTLDDFGLDLAAVDEAPGVGAPDGVNLKEAARAAAARTERRLIVAALEATDGNVTRAAERLGLSRRGLQIKMKELDLR